MTIKLVMNRISREKKEEIKSRVKSYQNQWIDCDVILE
jgi:hypothetical protein